ncbi:GNAT family N-acetyltransferase [Pararoseomonas sp. SCSIO 73927]|uniref:GNAT family N-acetyltransferase n=1 Tax=Pararoseomonas sp. SCSIO 73927 TaxID=3114537 RepID=UPI0030CCB6A4
MSAAPDPLNRVTTIPVQVEVTFLRMENPPADAPAALPPDAGVIHVPGCSVAFYRYLYNTVGRDWCWWLRRTVPDAKIEAILRDPAVSIHVLYRGGEPAGFYELERRWDGTTNLSYFGLMPQAIGQHMGRAFLRHAIDTAWDGACNLMTVNTCTADHPRALPNYVAAGFRAVRRVREEWPVPSNLGLRLPAPPRG